MKPKGAHSPGARALSMGVYPLQAIKSQIVDQDNVSHYKNLQQQKMYFFTNVSRKFIFDFYL